jgi:hypothetical protein
MKSLLVSLSVSLISLLLLSVNTRAQFVQQGTKLVGTHAVGAARQGFSVVLSSDENTAIIGGPTDSSDAGAAWVFTRSGSVWTQQGEKLVASALGAAQQGSSVSLSGDGNTALVGGPADGGFKGAVFVFTRSGGVWTPQAKLVATGQVGFFVSTGVAVALSADGNTAIAGDNNDNNGVGATYVFIRQGTTWSQQTKLVGTGAANAAWQGYAVAISADGNTAIIGGPYDSSYTGAAWIFTRSGTTWSQQARLVGTGVVQAAQQGTSVALSADGNTAIVGGPSDAGGVGGAWVFTRTGSVWTQQGSKLVGTGSAGYYSMQGTSVALSSDGNTALVGGTHDSSSIGATWVFTRSGGVWTQEGKKLVGSASVGASNQGYSASLSGDGRTALVGGMYDNAGAGAAWVFTRGPSAVGERETGVPQQLVLEQNYPNPFNPSTVIRYGLPRRSAVSVTVFNALGQQVARLVDDVVEGGFHEVRFDGSGLSSGIYFCRVEAGASVATRKLALIR